MATRNGKKGSRSVSKGKTSQSSTSTPSKRNKNVKGLRKA